MGLLLGPICSLPSEPTYAKVKWIIPPDTYGNSAIGPEVENEGASTILMAEPVLVHGIDVYISLVQ